MAAKEIPLAGYGPRLLGRVEVAEGTMAFHFEKPPHFDFKPRQSADLTLSNPPETDAEGNTRTFSIANSFENQLIFATRMRDTAFKRSLKKIPHYTCSVTVNVVGDAYERTSRRRELHQTCVTPMPLSRPGN
jgi:hypothetical protein